MLFTRIERAFAIIALVFGITEISYPLRALTKAH